MELVRTLPTSVKWRYLLFGHPLHLMGGLLLVLGIALSFAFLPRTEIQSVPTAEWKTAPAQIVAIEDSQVSENQQTVFAYHFIFHLDQQSFYNISYQVKDGQEIQVGHLVTVLYNPENPQESVIQGMRTRHFSQGAVTVLIFPLMGIALFLVASWRRAHQLYVIEHGLLADAQIIKKVADNTNNDKQVVYNIQLEFQAADGQRYPLHYKDAAWEEIEGRSHLAIVYLPTAPANAVFVNKLPTKLQKYLM